MPMISIFPIKQLNKYNMKQAKLWMLAETLRNKL